jgi:hypothetical protein
MPSSTFPFYRGSADQARQIDTRSPELPQANVGLWFTRFYDGFKEPSWEIDTDSSAASSMPRPGCPLSRTRPA